MLLDALPVASRCYKPVGRKKSATSASCLMAGPSRRPRATSHSNDHFPHWPLILPTQRQRHHPSGQRTCRRMRDEYYHTGPQHRTRNRSPTPLYHTLHNTILSTKRTITWQYVCGHSDRKWNDYVDNLADLGLRGFRNISAEGVVWEDQNTTTQMPPPNTGSNFHPTDWD